MQSAQRSQPCHLNLWMLSGLLLFSLFLCTALVERQPTGWDALGYQVAARNIVRGIGPAIEHPYNQKLGPYFTLAAFAGQRPQEPARLYLNYPPGFPLLLAIPQWLGLPDFLMLPILSTLSILLVYLLGTLLFERWTGLLGAAIVGLTPVFLEWGTSLWADVPGTCFMLGALTAYLVAWRKDKLAWQALFGSVAGVMVVVATFVKYTNALVLLPLFIYAVCVQRRAMFGSVVNWVLAAIVIIGLVGVGLYNQAIYGGPLETHYSASRSGFDFPLFSISYALGPSPADGYCLLAAGKTLWRNFLWLLVPAVLGLARSSRGAITLLCGVFVVFLGLSSAFAWAPVNEDTRYLLPIFAPVGLFAARGCLSVLALRVPWKKWALGLVLVVICVTVSASLVGSWRRLVERNQRGREVRSIARSLTAGSEPNAVFLAYLWNDPLNHFGERTTLFYRRMNVRNPAEFKDTLTRVVTSLLRDDLPVYYVEDRIPPLANGLQVLQQSFDLRLWKESPIAVYQIFLEE
jgi:4-amino-4-deoxy-L-arabinose transferase-like glycosyltransferase